MLEKQLCQRMNGFWEGVDSIYCDVKYASQRINQKQQLQEGVRAACFNCDSNLAKITSISSPPTKVGYSEKLVEVANNINIIVCLKFG